MIECHFLLPQAARISKTVKLTLAVDDEDNSMKGKTSLYAFPAISIMSDLP